jgi:hypothetical protein
MYLTNFKYLFQALVRPHIEYAEAVWSPFKVGDIKKIENVQRRATKQVPTLKKTWKWRPDCFRVFNMRSNQSLE